MSLSFSVSDVLVQLGQDSQRISRTARFDGIVRFCEKTGPIARRMSLSTSMAQVHCAFERAYSAAAQGVHRADAAGRSIEPALSFSGSGEELSDGNGAGSIGRREFGHDEHRHSGDSGILHEVKRRDGQVDRDRVAQSARYEEESGVLRMRSQAPQISMRLLAWASSQSSVQPSICPRRCQPATYSE